MSTSSDNPAEVVTSASPTGKQLVFIEGGALVCGGCSKTGDVRAVRGRDVIDWSADRGHQGGTMTCRCGRYAVSFSMVDGLRVVEVEAPFRVGDCVQPRPWVMCVGDDGSERPYVEVCGAGVVTDVSDLGAGVVLVAVRHDDGSFTSWPAEQVEAAR